MEKKKEGAGVYFKCALLCLFILTSFVFVIFCACCYAEEERTAQLIVEFEPYDRRLPPPPLENEVI